jgi:hypothetical protein
VDVLGWGTPLPSGFFESSAAADVSGRSLARLPDGLDTGDNAADFFAADPTPGSFNAPESLAVVEQADLPIAKLAPGTPWDFRFLLRNVGRVPWKGEVRVLCALHPAEVLARVAMDGDASLAPGAHQELRVTAFPPPGGHLPRSDPPAPEEGALWRGLGEDLAITEVYSRPPPDEVEWVEVLSRGVEALDLSVLRFHDAAGTGDTLTGTLAPRQFAIVAPDTSRFIGRWGHPPGALLVQLGAWPALNHTGSADEVAERVNVDVGEDSLAVATLPGVIHEGVSWERVSLALPSDALGSWAPSLDVRGGTPGQANSRLADVDVSATAGALLVRPTPFRPALDGAALIVLRPSRAASSCEMKVYDSSGLEVAALTPWVQAPGELRAVWDGRAAGGTPAPLGLYLVCATVRGSAPQRAPLVLVR